MTTVGAYIELKPGEDPPFHSFSCWLEADYHGKAPQGLKVSWHPREDEIPANAQVYLAWEPRVYAVWEDYEGIEYDQESNGTEAGITGEDTDAESDESA